MDNPAYADSRIVLFPHGPVQPSDKDIFTRLLLACGADINRFWDQFFTRANGNIIEHYVDYLKRSKLERCPELAQSIVLLAKNNPPALMVVAARRRLVDSFPILQTAIWMVCINVQENPFIFNNLRSLGDIQDEADPAPIFIDQSGFPYLLLVNDCTDAKALRLQAERVSRLVETFSRRELSTASRRQNPLRSHSRELAAAERPLSRQDLYSPRSITGNGDTSYSFASQPPPSTKRGR